MKVNMIAFGLGFGLLGISAGTVESNSNRFSLPLGIILGILGAATLFFSFEEHRNPHWLARQLKYLAWSFLPTSWLK